MEITKRKLKVFITVDTEVWEFYDDIEANIASGFWGITKEGEFGLKYQLDLLAQYNLKATFFVDPFFSYHSGITPLETAIKCINLHKQEVGLHIHTEWLKGLENPPFQLGKIYGNIGDFDLDSQQLLIGDALQILENIDDTKICSFRAGNYGANNDTLTVLNRLGITFDTTYNASYIGHPCNITTDSVISSPSLINDTIEIPVTQFIDYPNHRRHLQLGACSFSEIKDVLEANWQANQYSCVIVMHSFEWIKRKNKVHSLDHICKKRFLKLCEFLANNQDKCETAAFSDVDPKEATSPSESYIAKVKTSSTLIRLYEQLLRKVLN